MEKKVTESLLFIIRSIVLQRQLDNAMGLIQFSISIHFKRQNSSISSTSV